MSRRRAALAAAVLTLAVLPQGPVHATVDLPALRFTVVEADGRPVDSPVVLVSVFGPTYPLARQSTGGPSGQVVVPFPADDPVARTRLAAGSSVNLMIRVFDHLPGSGEVNAAYVVAAVGPDVTGVVTDLSSVSGQTFVLRPGRTAFQRVGAEASPPASCPPPSPDGMPQPCYAVDYPAWAENVPVPVADNHGAGADMVSSVRYNSSIVTQTSAAVSAGVTGFFRAEGSAAYENETSTGLSFRDRGNGENRRISLVSTYERQRSGSCLVVPTTGEWYCQIETVYRPYSATGTTSEAVAGYHDQLDAGLDCYVPVDGSFEPVEKSEYQGGYSFTLGPDEDWIADQGVMYANTTVTQQTHTKKGYVRRWRVVADTHPYHYMFVRFGEIVSQALNEPGGGACVRSAVAVAWTAAMDRPADYTPPVPVPAHPAAHPPADPNDPYGSTGAGTTFCGRMPDKCD